MTAEDDAVARNRAANPRRTPDRPQLGDGTLRVVIATTVIAIALATVVLLVFLNTG